MQRNEKSSEYKVYNKAKGQSSKRLLVDYLTKWMAFINKAKTEIRRKENGSTTNICGF